MPRSMPRNKREPPFRWRGPVSSSAEARAVADVTAREAMALWTRCPEDVQNDAEWLPGLPNVPPLSSGRIRKRGGSS
jgi:hypothetical protein